MSSLVIRPVKPEDKEWVSNLLREWWAGPVVETLGVIHQADELPGYVAEMDGKRIGLATYETGPKGCEITSFNSLDENKGVGTALFKAVTNAARMTGCRRLWLITTNDNTDAMRFYQKLGMSLVYVHRNAMDKARELKPGIPRTGNNGIPLRDEVELELLLQ